MIRNETTLDLEVSSSESNWEMVNGEVNVTVHDDYDTVHMELRSDGKIICGLMMPLKTFNTMGNLVRNAAMLMPNPHK